MADWPWLPQEEHTGASTKVCQGHLRTHILCLVSAEAPARLHGLRQQGARSWMVISEDEPLLTSRKASTATSTDVHALKTRPEVTMATGYYQIAMISVRQGSTPTWPPHESKAMNTCKGQVATSLLRCWG